MKIQSRHPWLLTPREAIAVQEQLRSEIVKDDQLGPVRRVAGIDVGFETDKKTTRAAVCVLSFPDLKLLEHVVARVPTSFPYVPGLLSFREAPAVLQAMEKLASSPDLLLYDGQGFAHPRRFGIASHVGLLCDIPTIGVAKTRLIGEHDTVPDYRGAWQPLRDGGEIIGAVLRTRRGVKPIFVSIGHRVGLATAIGLVMSCVTRYRLPETTRWAHRIASG
jgi:deoxyribonuclease V